MGNYYIHVYVQHRLKSKQCPKRLVKLISPSDSCILERVVNPRDQTRYKKPRLTPLMSYSESKVTAGDSTVHQTASCREWPCATLWSVLTNGRIFIQPAEIFIAYKLEGWSYYITRFTKNINFLFWFEDDGGLFHAPNIYLTERKLAYLPRVIHTDSLNSFIQYHFVELCKTW